LFGEKNGFYWIREERDGKNYGERSIRFIWMNAGYDRKNEHEERNEFPNIFGLRV
jgi:hypothetical protein